MEKSENHIFHNYNSKKWNANNLLQDSLTKYISLSDKRYTTHLWFNKH